MELLERERGSIWVKVEFQMIKTTKYGEKLLGKGKVNNGWSKSFLKTSNNMMLLNFGHE